MGITLIKPGVLFAGLFVGGDPRLPRLTPRLIPILLQHKNLLSSPLRSAHSVIPPSPSDPGASSDAAITFKEGNNLTTRRCAHTHMQAFDAEG